MADYAKIVAVDLLARIVEEGATQHGLPLLEGMVNETTVADEVRSFSPLNSPTLSRAFPMGKSLPAGSGW